MICIVTDSTCDLPEDLTKQLAITVVPLHINQGDNTYLDGINLSREEFYRQLPGYQPSPSTATPGPDAFTKVYNQLADEGATAVLSIHISETLSATINAARVAAEQFTRIPVTVLDFESTGALVQAFSWRRPLYWHRLEKWSRKSYPAYRK